MSMKTPNPEKITLGFCFPGTDAMASARRRALLALLLMELAQPTPVRPPAPSFVRLAAHTDLVRSVLDLLQQHLRGGLPMDELCRRIGYQPSRLRQLFHQQFGMTLTEALTRLRLEEAQRLLLDTTFKVSAVASAVGFAYAPKFNQFFRRHVGCTPTAFRDAHPLLGIAIEPADPRLILDEVRVSSPKPKA